VNTRYLEDEDLDAPREREISLGASTLLGIFLLLALVCAVFFGFGYSMGRRSSVSAAPSADAVEAATLKTTGAAKPAPGLTPAPKPSIEDALQPEDNAAPQLTQPVQAPIAEHAAQQKPQPEPAAKPASYAPNSPSVAQAAPAPLFRPTAAATGAPAGPPALVQVAAVSHQEDADILINALKHRGYDVVVRHEPQDKLLHIQLGPYATRKDADEMRKRLLADGYNAIVK
jgi:DedD protein